jgi:hypothetical protein
MVLAGVVLLVLVLARVGEFGGPGALRYRGVYVTLLAGLILIGAGLMVGGLRRGGPVLAEHIVGLALELAGCAVEVACVVWVRRINRTGAPRA